MILTRVSVMSTLTLVEWEEHRLGGHQVVTYGTSVPNPDGCVPYDSPIQRDRCVGVFDSIRHHHEGKVHPCFEVQKFLEVHQLDRRANPYAWELLHRCPTVVDP